MSPLVRALDPRPHVRPPPRDVLIAQAQEAVAISERGDYRTPSGATIDLRRAIARAVGETRDLRQDTPLASTTPNGLGPTYHSGSPIVMNRTSLEVARAIAAKGVVPMVLNFASALEPGGGFLRGAVAQEESLARASALYRCLLHSEMYAHHRALGDDMYTSWIVSSPDVPVFRDDVTGALLETPYNVTFLTSPAPYAFGVLRSDPSRRSEVNRVMSERVAWLLAVAAAEGHRHVVLGAWGCGAFGNDGEVVAEAFRRELEGPRREDFETIVFAVLDGSEDQKYIGPFARRFV